MPELQNSLEWYAELSVSFTDTDAEPNFYYPNNTMIKIYTAQDITEAQIIKGLLEANQIDAFVDGFYLQGGIGEMAPTGFAGISVEDDKVNVALDIIKAYEKNI